MQAPWIQNMDFLTHLPTPPCGDDGVLTLGVIADDRAFPCEQVRNDRADAFTGTGGRDCYQVAVAIEPQALIAEFRVVAEIDAIIGEQASLFDLFRLGEAGRTMCA